MEILLAAVVAAVVAGIVVLAGQRRRPAPAAAAGHTLREAKDGGMVQATAAAPARPGTAAPPDPPAGTPPADPGVDTELRARRAEIGRIEERLLGKEEGLDARLNELE